MKYLILVVTLLLINISAVLYADFTVLQQKNLYGDNYRVLPTNPIKDPSSCIPHHPYSSIERLPKDDKWFLCFEGWAMTHLGSPQTFSFFSNFIVTLFDQYTNALTFVRLEFVDKDGVFLADKYWINDSTLQLVFISLCDRGKLGKSEDYRGSFGSRSLMFAEIAIRKVPGYNSYQVYPIKIDPDGPDDVENWIRKYKTADKASNPTPEDIAFCVNETNEIHSLRFMGGQLWTLRMNYDENRDTTLWYDTLYNGVIDTTGYPIYKLHLRENDTLRVAYSQQSMFPGIKNTYH